MLIQSPWKLTWGTEPILALGDLMDDEIKGPSVVPQYQPVRPIRAPVGLEIGRGLVRGQLTVRRRVVFSTWQGAANFLLAHMSRLAALGAVIGYAPSLVLEKLAGGKWVLSNCKMTAHPTTSGQFFECEYQFDYGAIGVLTVPPEPVDPTDPPPTPDTLVTDGGDTMVTDTGDTRVTVD